MNLIDRKIELLEKELRRLKKTKEQEKRPTYCPRCGRSNVDVKNCFGYAVILCESCKHLEKEIAIEQYCIPSENILCSRITKKQRVCIKRCVYD